MSKKYKFTDNNKILNGTDTLLHISDAAYLRQMGKISSVSGITDDWVLGLEDRNGDFLYGKILLNAQYNKQAVKDIIDEDK